MGGAGKCTEELLRTRREQLQIFVHLAVETLKAEFPAYEILSAFTMFNLTVNAQERFNTSDHALSRETAATRLCNVFGVPLQCFLDEFSDHLPIALRAHITDKLQPFHAWKLAVQKTQNRKSVSERHPASNLKSILMRFGAFNGFTTSGVEQLFSKVSSHISPDRNHMSLETQVAEVKLLSDYSDRDEEEVCRDAQLIWKSKFGPPRLPCATRLDKGVKRKKQDLVYTFNLKSCYQFLSRRHQYDI